jgi:hypothetical protein
MNTKPFPTPSRQFSLTDNVELVRVDELYQANHNQFEMIPFKQNLTLRRAAAKFGINPSKYNIYQVLPATANTTTANNFKLISRNYNQFIQRKSTYFFVNVQFNKTREELELLLFEAWETHIGAGQSTVCFPVTPDHFKFIMPSRGKRFR